MKLYFWILLLLIIFSGVANADTPTLGKEFSTRLADCSGVVQEGAACWDIDNDLLYVGNGTSAVASGSGGDITSVGDCTGPTCPGPITVSLIMPTTISLTTETLTLTQVSGGIISNMGETDNADTVWTLPDLDAYPGVSFMVKLPTAMATNDLCIKAASDNAFVLDGTAGADNGCICNGTPTARDRITCFTTEVSAGAIEIECDTTQGAWAIVADNVGDCPN